MKIFQAAIDKPVQKISQLSVIFIAMCNFLVTFDITAVVVAMPTIRSELNLGISGFAWVMDAYSLSFTVLLLAAGVLADRFGRRRSLVAGLMLFLVASVICGWAPEPAWLWAGRILQGVGAAFVICGGLSLLATLHPDPADRVKAFALAGSVAGAAMALGPAGGGLLTDMLGWRWVFWINVPLSLVIIAGILTVVQEDEVDPSAQGRIDVIGVFSFTLFLATSIWVLLHGAEIGAVALPYAMGWLLPLAALSLFVASQILQKTPVFGLSLFRSASFLGMCAVPLGLSLGYWSMLVYLPLFLDEGLSLQINQISFWMLSITAPMIVLPFFGAKIALKLGERWFFLLGMVILALGCGLIAMSAAMQLVWLAIFGMFVAGCGTATVNAQVSGSIVAMVPKERAGTASAIATTLRQGGFALGIATLGAVLGAENANAQGMELQASHFIPVFVFALVGTIISAFIVFSLVPSKPAPDAA